MANGSGSLVDIGHPFRCNGCEQEIDASGWFWYVDAGAAHFTFCCDCSEQARGDTWNRVRPATAVRLETADGEVFSRIIDLSGTFANTPEP